MNQEKPPIKETWITLIVVWILCLIPLPFLGITGMAVNIAAFVMAIIVMSKGGTLIGIIQLLCAIIVTPIIYFIGLAIFATLASNVAIDSLNKNGNFQYQINKSFNMSTQGSNQNTIKLVPLNNNSSKKQP